MTATAEAPTIHLTDAERPYCGFCERRSGVLVEIEADSNHFVARCDSCIDFPAEPDEEHLSKNGKPAFDLTPEQRNAIFADDHTAIKFEPGEAKPEIEAGQTIVLARSRGGKQFLAKTERERLKRVEGGLPLLAEIPSEPTVWIVFHEPKLKEGRWQASFDAHDTRESVRTLASPPTGPRLPGLRTRKRKRVPKKGEYKAPGLGLSDDAARGYGGGGKSTVDEREGVDDASLNRYAQTAEEDGLKKRMKHRQAAKAMEREMRAAAQRKRRMAPAAKQAQTPLTVADTAAPVNTSAGTV
jgi:hypothetical protein